ncbi:hypothetical protein SERLADRAFT_439171 [Serpula lacrymans var. lacrymans S7.9]|uniref:Uncharacterized protein n=1 Tax=Serpula lacrymans var. lacrymans (strain S7.9) TaxID=578457 RepID=F8NZ49_SERL9|nr:uncharacterized protein SERLADRAFT_439171 [Serpula lacrymans var. lacrymans S7.9]EGO23869.1 hypothetical protein SERLADRAFT_439171 [Serpula lacrymans var. lacrymans S7.9]
MADGFGLAVSTQASSSNDIQGHLPSDVAMQSPQPAAESGGSTDDPASSLRAAALLSRKRRKVATERVPGLPTRPVPEASFQLDYGQEEPSSTLESSPAVTTVPDKRPSKSTTPVLPAASDVEDGQIREEGEISDNEETSPPSPPPPHRATTSRKNSTPLVSAL